MRRLLLLAIGLLLLATTTAARAEAQVRIRMGFPPVLPPLVQVQPGVRVVQDFDEEVFFIGRSYWVQRDGSWYTARDHRGTWRQVGPGRLPAALRHHEPGRYRRWQHDERWAWPEAQQARPEARHWRPRDHQMRPPPQEEHHRERQLEGRGKEGDRHEQDRP
jgi:hypothetical protein